MDELRKAFVCPTCGEWERNDGNYCCDPYHEIAREALAQSEPPEGDTAASCPDCGMAKGHDGFSRDHCPNKEFHFGTDGQAKSEEEEMGAEFHATFNVALEIGCPFTVIDADRPLAYYFWKSAWQASRGGEKG